MVGEFQNQYGGYGGGYGQDILLSPSVPEQPKKPKGMIIGIALIGILTVVAIGGSVYVSMMDSKTTTTEASNTTTNEDNSDDSGADSSASENSANTPTTVKDFVYVNDWGLKIKIPKNLKVISYTYINSTLCVNGIKDRQYETLPAFVDIQRNRLGCIYRTPVVTEGEVVETGDYYNTSTEPTFTKNNWNYWFSGPQSLFTQSIAEAEWEIESTKLVREMLATPGNYTNI